MPIAVVPLAKRRPASPAILRGETVAILSFSGLPEEPVFPGDQISGILLVRAQQNFVARAITIRLILASSVHRPGGQAMTTTYPMHHQGERTEFHIGQTVEQPFVATIPDPLPAPSIAQTENVGFSTQWYLEGCVYRSLRESRIYRWLKIGLAVDPTITSEINVARERLEPRDN
jgi:hypothetical protein